MTRRGITEVATLVADRVARFPGTRPFVATGALDDEGRISPELVTFDNRPSRADVTILPGDVCFARMQGTQKVFEFGPHHDNLILSTGFAVLRASPKLAHSRYLYHFLRTSEFQTAKDRSCSGATQKAITNEKIEKLTIPLRPLEEQRQIAEVLDRAEALRAWRRDAINQIDSLTQSLFLDLFGNPTTNPKGFPINPLASLVRDDDTINYGVVQPGDELAEGIPLVRVGDLIEGRVKHSKLKRIAPTIEAAYKRSRLRGDEVLLVCVGATAGLVALADETVKKFNIARAIARIPLAEKCDRIYMAAYLRTDSVQRLMNNELRTVAQPTLNIKQICELPVVHPPIELQREFARRVCAVEKLMSAQRASLAELDALFATLQHHAFRSES